jgi:aminoglycoside/choline kinase family phosphotransferase
MKDARAQGLADWARTAKLGEAIPENAQLVPVSDDASFRRYFRFAESDIGLVFVDAPPEHEDNPSFVKVSDALTKAGITCPVIRAVDYEKGYMVITDLGNRVYLDEMGQHPGTIPSLYDQAIETILAMIPVQCDLPDYDESRLRTEMSLFDDWFLAKQLKLQVTDSLRAMLDEAFDILVRSALEQPTGFVHRDYHCRNLMVLDVDGPGVIDFQDALVGPVTYDLVSLYKDCYFRFDREEVISRVSRFSQQLLGRGLINDEAPVLRWFDLMGMQRHLKCAGIFSRLHLRDGKARYLGDIPLVVSYLNETSGTYSDLSDFNHWLRAEIVPRMNDPIFQRVEK